VTTSARTAWRRDRDLDRVYWSLVMLGPMTALDLQEWTRWRPARATAALEALLREGCVTVTPAGQWAAVRDEAAAVRASAS
jgi:hypothetical protein